MILEPGEAFEVGRWNKVCARGKELAEFDEGRPEPFEIFWQLGGCGRDVGSGGVDRWVVDQRRMLEQIAAAIFGGEDEEILVKLEVVRVQRQSHTGVSHPVGGSPVCLELQPWDGGSANCGYEAIITVSGSGRRGIGSVDGKCDATPEETPRPRGPVPRDSAALFGPSPMSEHSLAPRDAITCNRRSISASL